MEFTTPARIEGSPARACARQLVRIGRPKQWPVRLRTVAAIVRKYSNFVAFPILINGQSASTHGALWMLDEKEVTEAQHTEFYRFIANAHDEPLYRMRYVVDAPLQIRALLYFPSTHMEKFGLGRLEPGVSLYCRRVLIQAKAAELLPDWMRFVRGVVDSEDIPLNLSRELLQNKVQLAQLRTVLSSRIVKFLNEQAVKDPVRFGNFLKEFGNFVKEGVCTDAQNQQEIAKLLRFESSKRAAGEKISLEEYVKHAHAAQRDIFYLCAPSRELAESSPYFEQFKRHGTEVLFCLEPLDEIAMSHMREFASKRLLSVESSEADASLSGKVAPTATPDGATATSEGAPLGAAQVEALIGWLRDTLGPDRVSHVKVSKRLRAYPAVVTDHESATVRRMMRLMDSHGDVLRDPPRTLEINPDHELLKALFAARTAQPQLAASVAHQLMDNALMAAGLLDDPRAMLPRVTELMQAALASVPRQ